MKLKAEPAVAEAGALTRNASLIRADRYRSAGARDGSGQHVGRSDGLIARCLKRGAECPCAVSQCAVGRQYCLAIGAGEVDGAGITGGRVVELIQRRHGEAES